MSVQVELQQIDDVPRDSRVAHYDELELRTKEQLFELVENGTTTIRGSTVDEFESHDVIKFIDYYEVSVD